MPVFQPTIHDKMYNFGDLNLNGFEQNFIRVSYLWMPRSYSKYNKLNQYVKLMFQTALWNVLKNTWQYYKHTAAAVYINFS